MYTVQRPILSRQVSKSIALFQDSQYVVYPLVHRDLNCKITLTKRSRKAIKSDVSMHWKFLILQQFNAITCVAVLLKSVFMGL